MNQAEDKEKRELKEREKEEEKKKEKLKEIEDTCLSTESHRISFRQDLKPDLTLDQKIGIMKCVCGSLCKLFKVRNDMLIFRCRGCRTEYTYPIDHYYFEIKDLAHRKS